MIRHTRRGLLAVAAWGAWACTGSTPPRWLSVFGGGPFDLSTGNQSRVFPARLTADARRIEQLRLPQGFRLSVFASGLGNARMLAAADDGTVFVTRQAEGDVLALPDGNRDGRADRVQVVATNLDSVNGVALRGGELYLATPTRVYVAARGRGGALGPLRVLVDGLPEGGRHPNRTLGFGPDGWLYVSVGSSCNACIERNPEHATLLRVRPDSGGREVFARGLRNTIGFDWHPSTGELWGMDHGTDGLGDDVPREELNRLVPGGHYGWPWCYNAGVADEHVARQGDRGSPVACADTRPDVLGFTAHAAPMAMVFYRGAQFPPGYRGDAFVAMHGSWNRRVPTGYAVVRVRFVDGHPAGFEDFLTGFLVDGGRAQFGRPVGLAVAPDGALLVADDSSGVVYRIVWAGGA